MIKHLMGCVVLSVLPRMSSPFDPIIIIIICLWWLWFGWPFSRVPPRNVLVEEEKQAVRQTPTPTMDRHSHYVNISTDSAPVLQQVSYVGKWICHTLHRFYWRHSTAVDGVCWWWLFFNKIGSRDTLSNIIIEQMNPEFVALPDILICKQTGERVLQLERGRDSGWVAGLG